MDLEKELDRILKTHKYVRDIPVTKSKLLTLFNIVCQNEQLADDKYNSCGSKKIILINKCTSCETVWE